MLDRSHVCIAIKNMVRSVQKSPHRLAVLHGNRKLEEAVRARMPKQSPSYVTARHLTRLAGMHRHFVVLSTGNIGSINEQHTQPERCHLLQSSIKDMDDQANTSQNNAVSASGVRHTAFATVHSKQGHMLYNITTSLQLPTSLTGLVGNSQPSQRCQPAEP